MRCFFVLYVVLFFFVSQTLNAEVPNNAAVEITMYENIISVQLMQWDKSGGKDPIERAYMKGKMEGLHMAVEIIHRSE